MKLTKAQKKLIKKINNPHFTVEFCEKCYKEKPEDVHPMSYTLGVKHVTEVNAFMTAVNGILDIDSEG